MKMSVVSLLFCELTSQFLVLSKYYLLNGVIVLLLTGQGKVEIREGIVR